MVTQTLVDTTYLCIQSVLTGLSELFKNKILENWERDGRCVGGESWREGRRESYDQHFLYTCVGLSKRKEKTEPNTDWISIFCLSGARARK